MSLKDDLLRNRRIFELLTDSEPVAEETPAPVRQSAAASSVAGESYDAETRKPFSAEPQDFAPHKPAAQKTEAFSLGFGRRVSRETGMALSLSYPESIAFPELERPAAPAAADPLESLYHKFEAEARRSSQLLSEEEF